MNAPDHYVEHVIEYFKQFVDREAIRENLRLTPEERIFKLQRAVNGKDRDRPTSAPSPE